MRLQLLGQGYEPKSELSVGNLLIKFFSDKQFHTFTGFSAFTSQSGINGLSKHILAAKKFLKSITIVTGVDLEGTSKEALEALLQLKIDAYIFYQPSHTIFHPKIYLFEGKDKSELIIGSSNLTAQGLFSNVETSLLVSMDNKIDNDRKIVDQLKEYFKGIFDRTDPNLKMLSRELTDDLVKLEIVPNEAKRKAKHDKEEKAGRKETEKMISQIFPKRAIAKIPKEFKGHSTPSDKSEEVEDAVVTFIKSRPSKKILWQSGPLTERDLNIPHGSNTNPTGSMLFKKGKTKDIDQRHYFRDTVFASLNWNRDSKSNTAHLERAEVKIKIMIDGNDCGDFELTLTHNTDIYSRSYEQKNSMTSISWGKAKKVIAKHEYIGKSATLYRNTDKKDEFTLFIE